MTSTLVATALAGAREFLGMDVAFIGEFTGGERVFRHVDSALDQCPVQPGGADALEETYCQRVIDGRLPGIMPDVSAFPEATALPVTHELGIGAYLSVPIERADGTLYGSLCAYSANPIPQLSELHLGSLQLLAKLLAHSLERESAERRQHAYAAAEITHLIATRGLTTVYQPIVDLGTGHAVGFEALSRFEHGRPDEWFARAANVGLTIPLELAALDSAMQYLFDLPADGYVAVNLSAEAMCSDEFAALVPRLPLGRLVLELTEQTEVASYEALAERTAWLRSQGARVALDDAGSGYAGLQRILALAPDILKLDLELIRDIDSDPARQSLAVAMAGFAERTGATLIAEGIETEAQLQTLTSLGVRFGQGYYLGRPGPATTARTTATVTSTALTTSASLYN